MPIRIKLKPDVDGVRLRLTPVDGEPVGMALPDQVIDCLEADADALAKLAASDQWVKIRTPDGKEAYTAAWFFEEAEVYVSPLEDNLRVRLAPVDGEPIGQIHMADAVRSLEPAAETRAKIGQDGEWLKIRLVDGREAYTAAWYLKIHEGELPAAPVVKASPGKMAAPVDMSKVKPANLKDLDLANITGMNLDARHPLGTPDPAALTGMGWVRFGYDVSDKKGSEDIDAAYNFYKPLIERYARAGFKVLLCFTHQTYGEGKNKYWPWNEMTTAKWQDLTAKFTEMVGRIVRQYAGQNLVHAYQIWNEMDAHIGAVASVPMLPNDYAIVLGETIKAIKGADPSAFVITGGHTGGPGRGSDYARETMRFLPAGVKPDGIAFHPYGRGITQPAPPYTIFGHIDDSLKQYGSILPDTPLWITEWGVLDRPHDNPADILNYAAGVVKHVKANWTGKVASMMWYAWAMGMHNGYGLVNGQNQPLQPLNDGFRKL